MSVLQAFGILLLGAGLGALLSWIQQTAARKQLEQELETQLYEAIFGWRRRTKTASHSGPPSSDPDSLFYLIKDQPGR